MTKNQQLILLTILGITDAYMISHPNILGRIGISIYKYSMLKTFPMALITVLVSLGVSVGLSTLLQKQKGKKWAKYLLVFLLMVSIGVFIDIYFKFSAGSYAHTGKVFKFGMHLLPIMLIYIFSEGLWNWIKASRI
jgi:uncharacterized membrane protein